MNEAPAQFIPAPLDRYAIERRVRETLRLRLNGQRLESERFYAPDFVLEALGPSALKPWVGRFEGAAQLAQMRRDITVEFELIDHALLDLVVDGEVCVTRRSVTYRNRGGGRPCTFIVWERYRFENGLIKDIVQQADPVALARLTGRLDLLASLAEI